MTQQEKQETKLNKLLKAINNKQEQLTSDNLNLLNLTGFFYSCGKLNALQVMARLTYIALSLNIDIQEITEILED